MSRPRVTAPSVAQYFDPQFVACFNGGFQEAQRGELRLIDENPEFIEVFLEYCRKGKATYKLAGRPEMLHPRKRVHLESCIGFIKFCDRYDLGQVLEVVEGTLEKLFKDGASKHLDVASVSHLAAFLDKDGPIFRLLMLACVRETLRGGPTSTRFSELLEEDNTVAAELMRQLLAFNMDDEPREFRAFYCPELKDWKAEW